MAHVIFYEKPGCINNSKQKKLLMDAGHHLECRNLLTEQWSKDALMEFLDGMSITMWFNTSAPEIKSGKIDPSGIGEDAALELMIKNPILIRRPLMRVGDECRVGFETRLVDQWIGLSEFTGKEDLENCPRQSGHSCDTSVAGQ